MLTLRHLPPAAAAHPNPVLRLYYEGLLSNWDAGDRLIGRLMSLAIAGPKAGGDQRRLGIPGTEWALARDRLDPAQMLTMRARKGLHRLMNTCAFPLRSSALKNKHHFAQAALAAGLAAPATFDPARDDAAEWSERFDRLILKPNFSSKGAGVRCLARRGCGWIEEGGASKPVDAAARVREISDEGGIVQPALTTHAALAAISPGALPTMRIVSIRDEAGEIEIAARILRVGGGGAPVDNFNRGGLAAVADESGALGAFFRHSGNGPPISVPCHPGTAAALPRALPACLHADANTLARAAHRAMVPDYEIVGWDIGLTPEGAVLIEGNWNPGTNVTQLLTGQSVLTGRSGELYRGAISRVCDAGWRSAGVIQRDNPRVRPERPVPSDRA